MKPLILVGMSGGVDSSVSAALLVKQGYRVIGGFIKNWSETKDIWSGECSWRGDRRDAMRVAAKLGIPLLTFDFEDIYRKKVIDKMFAQYARGVTPNPDVLCNQEIKFGVFFEAARRLKATMIATGHYARVRRETGGRAHLLIGKDPEKDQSYFLHRISQSALRRTVFPIGGYVKSDVRKLARDFGLPTAERKESMGICFIGKRSMKEFLRSRIPSVPGDVIDERGTRIGHHEGLDAVTIGQRHGFTVRHAGTSPWYAASKDFKHNHLVVVRGRNHPLLYAQDATVADLHWISRAPNQKDRLTVQVRYRQDPVPCTIKKIRNGLSVRFHQPVFAAAPGQSAVFYKGQECLGGGIIGH
ncbi:MAG: tRNA 2-thiouridine(34) synthase MnmA [Patescibacteria group bacterium]